LIEERVLALDLSTKTGWCIGISSDEGFALEDYGTLPQIHQPTDSPYPASYVNWAYLVFGQISDLIDRTAPTVLMVEETVRSKNAMSQKALEFFHFLLAKFIRDTGIKSLYAMPGVWRSMLICKMNKKEKEHNDVVRSYKKKNKTVIAYDTNKKRIGLVTRKHVSVRVANDLYGLNLKLKDNDSAEAILLGNYYNRRMKNK
jgi:hypothetical protein